MNQQKFSFLLIFTILFVLPLQFSNGHHGPISSDLIEKSAEKTDAECDDLLKDSFEISPLTSNQNIFLLSLKEDGLNQVKITTVVAKTSTNKGRAPPFV